VKILITPNYIKSYQRLALFICGSYLNWLVLKIAKSAQELVHDAQEVVHFDEEASLRLFSPMNKFWNYVIPSTLGYPMERGRSEEIFVKIVHHCFILA
jgi:hypothetical protein